MLGIYLSTKRWTNAHETLNSMDVYAIAAVHSGITVVSRTPLYFNNTVFSHVLG